MIFMNVYTGKDNRFTTKYPIFNAEDSYVDQFRPTLMEVVYLWSKGRSFKEISDATDVFEGSVVR